MMRYLFISLLELSICCNVKHTTKFPKQNSNISDTIIRDIPEWLEIDTLSQRRNSKLEKLLGLNPIQNGFYEYQVRIWLAYNNSDTQQTIIIKNYESIWTAEFFDVVLHKDKNGELKYIDKRVETKIPKSGWKRFIDSLYATGIDTLHDYRQIPNYNATMDPNTITVEIAKPHSYRFYQYPTSGADQSLTDPGKFGKAIRLIERQFDFRRIR